MTTTDNFTESYVAAAMKSGDENAIERAADLAGVTPAALRATWQQGRPAGEPLILDPTNPMEMAKAIVSADYTRDDCRVLHHQGGQFYEWLAGAHRLADMDTIKAIVWNRLADSYRRDEKSAGTSGLALIKPTSTVVNNTIDALKAHVNLHTRYATPCWLEPNRDLPPASEVLAMPNGLLHLPTRVRRPLDPNFWTHNATTFRYHADPPTPKAWLKFLPEVFPSDPQSIEVLQEIFGYLLLPDTRQHKIFLIVGPKRSGKGTIARVLTAILGASNVVGPTLASLSSPFGLAPLVRKLAAIISDARLGGRADQSQISERLLSISGEDSITVERKFLQAWTGRLSTRFVVMTNELPRLADASGALASRFVVLNMTQSFYGREDHGLTDRLLDELPGIFNWALAGYTRLKRRGYFVQPESARESIDELSDLGSPIGAFIRGRCIVEPGQCIGCKRLYEAWRSWCTSEGRDHPGTLQSFGRDLRAAIAGLRVTQHRTDWGRIRQYEGVSLENTLPT